jgi:hypothetical protein
MGIYARPEIYAFALVPSQGNYPAGCQVSVSHRLNDLQVLQNRAARWNKIHEARWNRSGYRVIAWNRKGDSIPASELDSTPDA